MAAGHNADSTLPLVNGVPCSALKAPISRVFFSRPLISVSPQLHRQPLEFPTEEYFLGFWIKLLRADNQREVGVGGAAGASIPLSFMHH